MKDRANQQHTANFMAEKMFSHCGEDVKEFMLLDKITEHCEHAILYSFTNWYIIASSRTTTPIKTIPGWEALCLWIDGNFVWF